MNTHFPDKSFSVRGKTFCGMNPISSQIIAYFMMSASFTNDRILAISLSRTSPFGQPSPKKLNRGLPVGASHILWEGTAVSFRVFVFGRCQKSNKLEAAPEVGPFAKIYYFYVTSPLGWLLWRDHAALLPVLFHPYVPPLCPTPMSHFLPGICWHAFLQVVYPESLTLCDLPFHPTQKGTAEPASADRPLS